MGDPTKIKKKTRVEEIDGVLWQLDDYGNKIKKVKRKVKTSDRALSNDRMASLSPMKPKRKLSVKEIDGVLFQVDGAGNPVKKVRRKNGEVQRAMSQTPTRTGDSKLLGRAAASLVLRAQSVGAPRRPPGEYTDSKGRRIVIEADGTKTVFDKNGKRLRPKNKDGVGEGKDAGRGVRAKSERLHVPASPVVSPRRANASLAKSGFEKCVSKRTTLVEPSIQTPKTGQPANKHEIAATLSEIDRENIELKMKLMEAKDQAEDLATKAHKEQQKNVKATVEADQLRLKHAQTAEHNQMLSLKIKNLEARLLEMDEKIEKLNNMPIANASTDDASNNNDEDHLAKQLAKLRVQNLSLLNKLDSQKAASSSDAKKKSEQIIILGDKVKKLRLENDKIFSGDADIEFVRMKLKQENKELTKSIEEAKRETRSKIDEMQKTVDCLHKENTDLKKQVEKVTLEINEFDDDEIRLAKEMAQAVAQHGTKNAARAKRASIQIANGVQSSPHRGFGFSNISALATASISNIAM
jgi:predicted nuclease with TOPRIM domain